MYVFYKIYIYIIVVVKTIFRELIFKFKFINMLILFSFLEKLDKFPKSLISIKIELKAEAP